MTEHRIMSESEKKELRKTYNLSGGGYKKIDAELKIHIRNIFKSRRFIEKSFASTPETTKMINQLKSVNQNLKLYRRETVEKGTEYERGVFFKGFKYWHQEVMEIKNKSYTTVLNEFLKDFDIDKELEKIKNGGLKQ